jgi:ATP-dependent helicase HrpB
LREDLRILVMSATLDGARVAKLLGDCAGDRERRPGLSGRNALSQPQAGCTDRTADGGCDCNCAPCRYRLVLAFLPGAAEIRRTQNFLTERVSDPNTEVVPLFGALDAAVQDRAISPAPKGQRKVVLATSIAETSLTIEGVRIVVDPVWRGCRAMSQISASRGWKPSAPRAPLSISAGAAQGAPSPACATGCGTNRRPLR